MLVSTEFLRRFAPQPTVSIVSAVGALLCVVVPWKLTPALLGIVDPSVLLLALCLGIAIVLAFAFPIHVNRSTQVCLSTVPIYLIAVLLQPLPAVITAGTSILASELVMRRQRKTYLSDIVTSAGRLAPGVLLAGLAVHGLIPPDVPFTMRLAAGAFMLWGIDIFSSPLILAPITGERPLVVLLGVLRHGSVVEVAQYPIGVTAALAASENPLWLLVFAVPIVAVYHHFKHLKELHDRTRQLLERIADTVDDHDAYTGGHSRRVALFTERIVKAMVIDCKEADLIVLAARIHDIGKIDIPASVLQKPGRLSAEERALIETHPDRGADMLLRYPGFGRGVDMIRFHHEAWDGTGYPRGLKGTAIPFGARVIAVADSFDAMTSDRPYRKGMPVHRAALEMQNGRGAQWDAECVDAFLSILPEIDLLTINGVPPLRLITPLQLDPSARAAGQ